MASPTGDKDAGSSGEAISFQLCSRDLPSRRLLGEGLSGIGYETIWEGKRFARKDFVGVPRNIFKKEAAGLVALKDHKNIVKTYGWTVGKRSCSLVLEYMDDDLRSLLQKKTESKQDLAGIGIGTQSSTPTSTQPFDLPGKGIGNQSSTSTSMLLFDLPEVLDIILQLARGMKYLHEQGIAHGDLKTKNILVTHMNDGDQKTKLVKVTDFGLVRTKRKSESIVSRQVRKLDIVRWKAPEYLEILFRQLNASNDKDGTSSESESEETSTPPVVNMSQPEVDVFAADVYSFAVTCSQILTGKDPYPNPDWKALGVKILSDVRPNLPAACPPFLSKLLIKCWCSNPAQRPTFLEICKELEQCEALLITDQSKPDIQMQQWNLKKMDVAASSSSKPGERSASPDPVPDKGFFRQEEYSDSSLETDDAGQGQPPTMSGIIEGAVVYVALEVVKGLMKEVMNEVVNPLWNRNKNAIALHQTLTRLEPIISSIDTTRATGPQLEWLKQLRSRLESVKVLIDNTEPGCLAKYSLSKKVLQERRLLRELYLKA